MVEVGGQRGGFWGVGVVVVGDNLFRSTMMAESGMFINWADDRECCCARCGELGDVELSKLQRGCYPEPETWI